MANHIAPVVLLDTSYLDSLLNATRPTHDNAVKYFKFWTYSHVIICTSTICLAEYSAYANELHTIFKSIISLPFNTEAALLAGRLFSKCRNHPIPPGSGVVAGRRDALKDDFKILATAAVAHVNAIAHNDASTLDGFIKRAKSEFEQCQGINSILLSKEFNERDALEIFGKSAAVSQQLTFFEQMETPESNSP